MCENVLPELTSLPRVKFALRQLWVSVLRAGLQPRSTARRIEGQAEPTCGRGGLCAAELHVVVEAVISH